MPQASVSNFVFGKILARPPEHKTSAPYHLSSNVQAERAVQTVKQGLKRTPGLFRKDCPSFSKYCLTPHSRTGIAPCELLMINGVAFSHSPEEIRQAKQKVHHDDEKLLREFALNDRVYVKNFPTKKPRWIAGTIVKITGRTAVI